MCKYLKKRAGDAGNGRPAERATADSWETSPMPDRHVSVELRVRVSAEEMARIEMGHIPQEMEDKWFMYCDGGHIRWFRSWSGYCIFDAEYEKSGKDYLITRLTINRDPSEFSSNDDKGNTKLFLGMTLN